MSVARQNIAEMLKAACPQANVLIGGDLVFGTMTPHIERVQKLWEDIKVLPEDAEQEEIDALFSTSGITSMNDRALEFAKYMVESTADMEEDEIEAVIVTEFGDMNAEEVRRGAAIAEEILAARIAENKHAIAQIKAALKLAA